MAFNPTQNIQQAYVIPGTAIRGPQTPVQLELFDREGNPWNPEGASLEGLVTREEFQEYQNEVNGRLEALEGNVEPPAE